jgi:peroxiredoxin
MQHADDPSGRAGSHKLNDCWLTVERAMRLLTLLCLACVTHTEAADESGQQRAEAAGQSLIGTVAPALVLKTIDGNTIDLAQLYGRQAVYLKFWATWCVPCREQMPHFEHVYETAGPDLAVIAIDTGFNDSLQDVETYRQKLGITMPIVLDDGQSGAAFHLRVTPQHIVIGRDGRIQFVGHLADARLDAALVAARSAPAAIDGRTEAASVIAPQAITHYTAGDSLPAMSVSTLDGKHLALFDSTGRRPTALVFLSPWCESYLATTRPAVSAACRQMREAVTARGREAGIRWLGIASGLWANTNDLRDYRKRFDINIPLTLDESGDLFRAFNVTQVPAALLVDPTGHVVRWLQPKDLASLRPQRTAAR